MTIGDCRGRDPVRFVIASTQRRVLLSQGLKDWNNLRLGWLSDDFDVFTCDEWWWPQTSTNAVSSGKLTFSQTNRKLRA